MPWEGDRPLRAGLLAEALIAEGHRVTWWSSTFDHVRKVARSENTIERAHAGVRFILLHGCSYAKNVSLRRMANHKQVAKEFALRSTGEAEPDIVLCSMPTIELCDKAVDYAGARQIPIVLDIRDLWPDIFVDAVPRWSRSAARAVLSPYFRSVKRSLAAATAIWGVSEGYLAWGLDKAGRDRLPADAVHLLGYKAPVAEVSDRAVGRKQLSASGIAADDIVCWFIGSLGRTYDLETVIDAAGLVADPRVKFVISGDGERMAALRSRAAARNNVVFTGWIDQRSLATMMAAADIALAAYALGAPQGIPNKIPEYMSAGLPILSSLRGETEEVMRSAGCGSTYHAGDAADLASQVALLADCATRRHEMGARGKAYYLEQMDAAIVYPRMIAELTDLAAQRAPARA